MMESAACVSVRCREHPMMRSTFSRAILAKKAYLGVLFVKGILRLQHTNLPIRFLLELSLLYHIISNVGWLVNAFSPTLSTQTHGDCRSFEEISEADETMQSKNPLSLGSYPKGQFCKNTVYLERGMPYFAFVDTNAVLVRKIDKA